MTRISTDSDSNTDVPAIRPFRRTLAFTVAVLVVLVAVFAGLNYLQGPRMSSARVDPARVVAQPGQLLRMFANQNLSAVTKGQVTVTPATPFSVSSSGEVISVQFTDRLSYDTTYRVAVRGVSNTAQPRTSTFDYAFSTAAARVYYLDRADPAAGTGEAGALDSIVQTGLRGSGRTVLYSAPRIQQFAVFPDALVVSSLTAPAPDTAASSDLALVARSDTIVEHLILPATGIVENLHGASDTGRIGFTFTSTGADAGEYVDTLMTADLTGDHSVNPVLDLASAPLSVTDWSFVTGSATMIVQTPDQSVFLVDPAKPGSLVPVGQYPVLGQTSSDGSRVVLGDIYGRIAYTFATGKETRLPSLPVAGAATSGSDAILVGSGNTRVQQVAVFGADASGRYQSFLVFEQGTQSRILYQSAGNAGSIEGFSVSPNGQYLAVTVIPDFASSISDGYAADAQSTSVSTIFIDIASGSVVRSVDGFGESWG